MSRKIVFLIVLCTLYVLVKGKCHVTLQQSLGSVKGYGLLNYTLSGDYFCSFLGIPYLKPPVGQLRLELPQPFDLSAQAKEWDFRTRSPNCIQDQAYVNATGQEDCLYLNVYTKVTQNKSLKPVIVWIHGGGFQYGSANSNEADRMDYLVDKDVIVVTFNYRLGALGFLYREDDNLIANLGLKDQLEALKWINKNIAYFGGDPKRVTLMGWSAGGAAVSYHLQAPASAGLFHAAILLSGTLFNPWAYFRNTETCTKALCKSLNVSCSRGELKDILKTLPEGVFQTRELGYDTTVSFFGQQSFCFLPVAERNEAFYGTAMVQDKQHRLMHHQVWNDVPIMIGYATAEFWPQQVANVVSLSGRWNYSYPNIRDSVIRPLRKYLISGTKELNNESKRLLVFAYMINGIKEFTDYYRAHAMSNTYFYRFSHKNISNDLGAVHGDDLRYIFVPVNDRPITSEDIVVRERMVRYVTDFAKYRQVKIHILSRK